MKKVLTLSCFDFCVSLSIFHGLSREIKVHISFPFEGGNYGVSFETDFMPNLDLNESNAVLIGEILSNIRDERLAVRKIRINDYTVLDVRLDIANMEKTPITKVSFSDFFKCTLAWYN